MLTKKKVQKRPQSSQASKQKKDNELENQIVQPKFFYEIS